MLAVDLIKAVLGVVAVIATYIGICFPLIERKDENRFAKCNILLLIAVLALLTMFHI